MTLNKFNELGEQWMLLKDVPKGGLFRLSDSRNAPVWVRDEYSRMSKGYYCYKYEDVNHESTFKGTRKVYIGFEY